MALTRGIEMTYDVKTSVCRQVLVRPRSDGDGATVSTLREIAEICGVDISTVSRVLNGRQSGMVSAATRDNIRAAAKQLQYRPSAAARALASGRSRTVVVGYSRPDDPHFMPMLIALKTIVEAHDYHLQIAFDVGELKTALRERSADIVLSVNIVDLADEFIESIAADHQRVIAIGPAYRGLPEQVMCAYWHDGAGIRSAVEHLVELGHHRIAFLAGISSPAKYEAFNAVSDEPGIEPVIVRSDSEDDLLAAGAQMARRLLRDEPSVTGVVARNDEFACGALHALREASVAVPEDISIVGFNDIEIASYLSPSLTTIRTPLVECARLLVPAALESIAAGQDNHWRPEALEFSTSLVVRSSTAPLDQQG